MKDSDEKKSNRKGKKAASTAESVGQEKKKSTSLRLRKETLKALKIQAIEQDTSIQALIESLIEDYLKRQRKK